MMKKWILRLVYSVLVLLPVAAIADYTATTGAGTTVFAFTCFVSKVCPAQTITNSSGTEILTSSNPGQVTGANGTFPITAASLPLPTGAATSANQTNKTQLTQLTDGTNAATTYTSYGSAPTGNVPGVNAFVTNANANGQTTMSGSAPVTIASNQSVGDPCTWQAKTNAAFSSASGTFAIVTGVSAKRIYVCAFMVIAPSAVSVSLAEGSSSTCGTSNQAAVVGVATSGTAANGVPLAANAGWTMGSGIGVVAQTATAANYLCIFQSGTAQLAGNIVYVQQ